MEPGALRSPDADLERLVREVMDAAFEVHRELGPGYLESVYQNALEAELEARGVVFARQATFEVIYKGRVVGGGRVDLVVGGRLLVEVKAVDRLGPIHFAQILSYLKARKALLGLLINFHVPVLKEGFRRVIRS